MIYVRCDRCGADLGIQQGKQGQACIKLSITFDCKIIEYADCCAECAAEAKKWIDGFRAVVTELDRART